MKKIALTLVLLSMSLQSFAGEFVTKIHPSKVIKIELGEDGDDDDKSFSRHKKRSSYDYNSHHYANRKLRRRVRQLELAVQQLQEEIFHLRSKPQEPVAGQYVCVLDAGSRGLYLGKARTRNEAKALAFQKCSKKKSDFLCDRKPLTCEQEMAH